MLYVSRSGSNVVLGGNSGVIYRVNQVEAPPPVRERVGPVCPGERQGLYETRSGVYVCDEAAHAAHRVLVDGDDGAVREDVSAIIFILIKSR